MILNALETAYVKKEKRGWDKIYIFIDIHDTIFEASYEKKETYKYFPNAKEALQLMSQRKDIVLGLYTRSYPKDIAKYLDKFEEDGIHFELVNENPLEKNTAFACFDQKPYYNVLIDDNAGFNPYIEWQIIYLYLTSKN